MSKFNFDSEFFRRIISKCEKTEKITSLARMVKEATEVFYDEYDYYPELGVYAPGAFTIMGDHLEYLKGNLVQAALPLGVVVVGKSLSSVKCKLSTTSKHVEGLRKSVFPISHYKKNLKVFPEWVNYIKGVINVFPDTDVRGFDAVIHSNVPFSQGYGSSAALQVGFYTFLEAVVGEKKCKKKAEKGNLCCLSEEQLQMCEKKLGRWSNLTSSVAEANTSVKINCRTKEVSTFDMRDINILFLLTYPNFEIELNDRDYVCRRKMELNLAAKLLGLEEIIDATEYHLGVLENMDDPTRETVIEILRGFGVDEKCIEEFVEELFYSPSLEVVPEDYLYGEGLYETELLKDFDEEGEYGESEPDVSREITPKVEKGITGPCKPPETPIKWAPKQKPPPVSYFQTRIAELCAVNQGSETNCPQRICEEINCLGGLENLSVESGLTICGKLLRRVRHVVTENIRSLTMSDLTSQLDYEELGTKLIQSHLSLKLDFEVSCHTLDELVQVAIDSEKVYGAKMTSGGGTLTLLHRSVVEKFIEKVTEKFGECFQFYLVFPTTGARILNMGVRNNPKSTLSNSFLNRGQLLKRAVENFVATYEYRPTHGAFSPGIVSLMGDHNDYNNGFSLLMAVNFYTIVVGALNGTSKIRIATTADVGEESQKIIFPVPELEELKPGTVKWAKIVKGVVAHFKGFVKGFDCIIESSVRFSSGVSSKSALVMSLYTFLEEITNEKSVGEKPYRCMLAVQEFTNLLFGIGDNLAAERSKENFIVLVDSWTTATTLIPYQDPSIAFLLIYVEESETNIQPLLYKRMEECYQVAKALGGKSLRCLTLKDLDAVKYAKKKVSDASVRRAAHILKENERSLKAAEALKNNDYDTLGELLIASHNSFRDEYEVISSKMDRLVATAMEVDGVLGTKTLCGGYMNCIVSLVKRWALDDLIDYMQKTTSEKLTFYVVSTSDGCGALDVKEHVQKLPSPQFTFESIFPF